jgi:hypothetical protein
MDQRLSATRAFRGPRGLLPIAGSLLAGAALVAAWLAAFPVDRPSGLVKFDPAPRRWLTELPSAVQAGQPATNSKALVQFDGRDRSDGLLVVGDSRASAAISLRLLERELHRPCSMIWYGFAQYDLLLEGVRTLEPRTLLVCLTPAALHVNYMKRMELLLERERDKTWMRRLDDTLDDELDALRKQWLRPLDPTLYKSWTKLDAVEPERQVGVYVDMLAKDHAARLESLRRLEDGLRALQAEGRRIVCVRLPVLAKLEQVEDMNFEPRLWSEMCARLGAPYLDSFGGQDAYATSDGSHLVGADAERYTLVLAAWLQEQGLALPE